MKRSDIDNDREFDWGRTARDYARYRPGYPESFYDLLPRLGVGLPGQRILDLGTGTGVLARELAKRGATVTAVDVAAGQREAWRGRIRACRGVGASLDRAAVERFDAEHDRLLREIAPESFTVLHQITVHVFTRKGGVVTPLPD